MEKKKLGILIGILRKEKYKQTKNSKWLQVNFCEGVCSKSTLSRLEAGLIISYEEIYVELSNKLGFGYASIDLIDTTVKFLGNSLLKHVDLGNDKEIIIELRKIKELLSLSKTYIYYHQLGLIIDDLLNYYSEYKFTPTFDFDSYIELIDVYITSLSSVVRMYLYLCIHNTQEDAVYNELVPKIHLHVDESLAVQICYFHYLFILRDTEVLNMFEPLWQRSNARRRKELQSLLKLYQEHFKSRLPETLYQYTAISLEEKSIMSELNDGVYALHKDDIEDFARIYEELFLTKKPVPTFTLVQYMYNVDKLDNVLPLIESENYITRDFHKLYFRYLAMRDDLEKQNYIMDVIYNSLREVNRLYLDFFTREIHELSKTTKRYKDLHRMLELYK